MRVLTEAAYQRRIAHYRGWNWRKRRAGLVRLGFALAIVGGLVGGLVLIASRP